jgi:hypothetical protein
MTMRGRIALALIGALVLCAGLYTADALGGKKKKTAVVVESTSVLQGKQNVRVIGHLNSANKCKPGRSMRLWVVDANGVVTQVLNSGLSESDGSWKLKGRMANPPTPNDFLQVKARKRTVGKVVCRAGLSPLIAIK